MIGTALSRRHLLGAGVATLAASTLCRPVRALAKAETLSPAAMRQDVRLLRRAYEALHPGLLRYNTPQQIAAGFERLEADSATPQPLEAFYLRLSRFLAAQRCGHSYANFYNQSRAVQTRLFETPDRLPFQFLWLGDRMIVTADPTGAGIAPGSEIVRLNGRPVGEVLAGLIAVARADGGNDGKRRQLMSVQGQDGYESFDVFYPLMFGSRARHALEVVGADGRTRRTEMEAISLEARRAQRPPVIDAADDTPAWTMERRGPTALLTMPGWACTTATGIGRAG